MDTSTSFLFLFFLLFTITSANSNNFPFPSSTVASVQAKFWSKNVINTMPDAILSKLSPLSVHDSEYFTSLASKQSFSSDLNFCTLANLACAANLDIIKPLANRYSNSYSNQRVIQSSHIAKIDPFSFFRISNLQEGKRIHLPDLKDTCPSRSFLPSEIASKISLSSNGIKTVFPESFLSPVTKEAIQMTLLYCNAPALRGETKKCPRSLEEMVEFAKKFLGKKQLLALTSKSTKGSAKELIIGSIKQYDAEKIVSCHEIFLPFSTYFCHLISSTKLFSVDLIEPETRAPVNTVLAVCHLDTSAWPADHVAFKILKLSPGKGEACHFFSQIDLAWIGA